MTSVGAVTRQIAALELSKQGPPSSSSRSLHNKQPGQPNVAKLLSKFAAPNPFPNAKPAHPATQPMDIGRYDGGLEIDDEKRGEVVYGEAAEELALDSSVSRCVVQSCTCTLC